MGESGKCLASFIQGQFLSPLRRVRFTDAHDCFTAATARDRNAVIQKNGVRF